MTAWQSRHFLAPAKCGSCILVSPCAQALIILSWVLILTGVLLTFIFTGFSFVIAGRNENRIKGFGIAILAWLFLAVIYDGLFLLSLILFQDYPVEKLSLILTVLKKISWVCFTVFVKLFCESLFVYLIITFQKQNNLREMVSSVPAITGHNIWNFLEYLGKIISVPFLKVAFSRGKVGRPSKPYIPGKSGM